MSNAKSGKEDKIACIGSRLKIAREQAGLSQSQVAKLMNIHRPSISEIEGGKRKVSADELGEFAKIYAVDIAWLACLDENTPDENRDAIMLAARGLAKLQPEDLDHLLNLISSLRNQKK